MSPEELEVALKLALACAAIALLALLPRLEPSTGKRLLTLLAAVAAAAYFNFGTFHSNRGFSHAWEQFHYFLGAKYFPEVGYDGLYVASMAAEMRTRPGQAYQPWIRDLRTNEVVHTLELESHGVEVYRRFSPERWSAFVRDHEAFLRLDPTYLQEIRRDHGFNASPAWIAVARPLASALESGPRAFAILGSIDIALLAVVFFMVYRAFGATTACLAILVFALGYPWRFFWTGGAFLRHDWLAALILAACALERRWHGAAGALLAYATTVRVFPLLLWAGPAAIVLVDVARQRFRSAAWHPHRWFARMAVGFLFAAGFLFLAGSATGRGPEAWREFSRNLQKHAGSWLTNNVGLANLVLYDGPTYRREHLDVNAPEPWWRWQEHLDRRREEHGWAIWGAAGVMLGLIAWRARHESPEGSLALGVPAVFAFANLTCYYWSLLVLFALRRGGEGRVEAMAVLGVSSLVASAHFLSPAFELRYGLMSWLLAAFFTAWLASPRRRSPTPGTEHPTPRTGATRRKEPRTRR